MSGLYSQIGVVKEIGTPATITGITFTAGIPNIGTVAATAHGHRVGDVVTLIGFTPAAWNGTWVIQSVTTNAYVISVGVTVIANSTVQGTESLVTKYGGGGTVSRFWELGPTAETFQNDRKRVVSDASVSGQLVDRADRFAVYPGGGAAALVLEVTSKGFGYWFSLLMGTVVASGPTDTAAYTYTGTPGSLLGQSVAVQAGRAQTITNIVQPFTYVGAKVQSWSLDCTVNGKLMLTITFSFQDELLTVALAAPSYPSGAELLTFVGGAVTLGAIALSTLKTLSIQCDEGLTAVGDRVFINNGGLPAEPLQNRKRTFKWSADVEYTDMNAYNRYVAATAAGTIAALSCVWTGPTLIAGCATTYPSFTVTAPKARHDGPMTPNINGAGLLTQKLTGPLLNTNGASNDAVTLVYVTGDTTA